MVPALASEKETSPQQTVSTETKTETGSNSAPATPLTAGRGSNPSAPRKIHSLPLSRPAWVRLAGAKVPAASGAALTAFYEGRQYKPLWVTPAGLSASADKVIAEIRAADDWGLKASDFNLPTLGAAAGDAERADAEVDLGLAVLKYARFARGGRLDPDP